jgi:ABC-type branched-subunit amino acid transport system substrate-binding protein
MHKNRRRGLSALLAIGLLAAACGSDRKDDTGTTATTTTAGGPTATAAATTTTTPGVTFGDLASPCGKGDAKGATANGVSDTSITIGYGDDAGYAAAPGLNKEMSDAMKAMIQWCNDQGGINGRKVEGQYYDAKLLEVTQAMTQACTDKVFMLVGQGWALDAGQEKVRIDCKLSTIPSYSVSSAFANGPGMIQSLANPADQAPASGAYQLAKLFPDAIKKTAFVFADYPPTRETRDKYVSAFPQAGYQFLDCDQIYNIGGEADWKPFANNLKSCGVDFVIWVGSPNPNFQNFLAAAKQVGFAPKAFFTDANHYDAGFAKWNGDNGGAGDNVYVRMAAVPFEESAKVPAVKQYIDLVTKSGGKLGLLGVQSTGSFLLWATGVKACGSTVTAKCVLDNAGKQTNWTAGGLHTPMSPGKTEAPDCGMLVKLSGGTFTRVTPTDKTFECDPKFRISGIKTTSLEQAKLDANRVATQFGQFTPA